MLIWIDQSVTTANLAEDEKACRGVSAICDAVARGHHYALGDRQTLATLAADPHLAAANRTTIRRVLSNLPTLGGIQNVVELKVRITYGGATTTAKRSHKEWEVPLQDIADSSIFKVALLAENLIDAETFEEAAKQYMASQGLRSRLSLERLHGGGSTTPNVFENHAKGERRWCLCITDSDRLCPDDGMSKAAQECTNVAADESLVAAHFDLPAREIENVLPLALLDEAIPATHREKWDWHANKLYKLRRDAHIYCDLKSGFTIRKLLSMAEGSRQRTYWKSVTKDLLAASALVSDCLDNDGCSQHVDSPCHCHVIYGFGEKVLEISLEIQKKRSAHESERRTRNDPNRAAWLDVGRLVFEWGCAPPEIRV